MEKKEVREVKYSDDTSWHSEINHFLSSITQNTPILNGSSTDALAVMQVIDIIYASGKLASA